MMDWMKNAVAVDNVEIDIGFNIRPSFYFGPSGGTFAKEFEHLHEKIYQPKITLNEGCVLSRHVMGFESELIKYYRDVIRLSQKHEKRLLDCDPHFWLFPFMYSTLDFPISFPRYDHFDECEYVFKALMSETEGEIFDDEDQGWELHIYLQDGKLYFHQSDPQDSEQSQIQVVVQQFPKSELSKRLEQTQQIINTLIKEFGFDRWSRHIY